MNRRGWTALGLTVALLTAGIPAAVGSPVAESGGHAVAAAAEATLRDGSTSALAAPSCWAIKQQVPDSQSGTYWLYTASMRAPEQFACDMVTDGGGWVLVGRGRENWRMEYEGVGTTAQVRADVTGPAAFNARQLSSSVIDDLLDGQRVDALQDGIRLRRATTTDGTAWQEVRFNIANRDRWAWTFAAEHRVTQLSFDGAAAPAGQQTSNFGTNNALRRVQTTDSAQQNYTRGFAFGTSTTGSNSANSYVWSAGPSVGSARPFTQVWLRPRVTSTGFQAVEDQGLPAQEQVALAQTRATPSAWGVTGLATSGGELRTEVQAFAQIGDTMYVGGNFRYVQRDSSGSGRVEQPFLAAFDVDTGEWRQDFRPVLNDQVKALVALPDGSLAVGGEFSTVNGSTLAGVAMLDAQTGTAVQGRQLRMENRLTSGILSVRSLKVDSGRLYIGGAFTHLAKDAANIPPSQFAYARGAARVPLDTFVPDRQWNPNFNGTVNEVDPSPVGDRVYAAGYFSQSGSAAAPKGAAVSTATGAALVPWTPTFSSTANFQFTVSEAGERVWLGGSEHSFFAYGRDDLSLQNGNITRAGGDFQTSVAAPEAVYAGCHCGDFSYQDTYTWPTVGTNWTQADKIGIVGAWDRETGHYLPEFDPIVNTRGGYGAWASAIDDRGRLWLGGSYDRATMTTGSSQWVGGFVRFDQRDAQAPTTPADLTVTPSADGEELTLSWPASSDDRAGGVQYDVVLDDRVLLTTSDRSVTVPTPEQPSRWFVRGVDQAGNASATTPVTEFDPEDLPRTEVALTAGSTWRWRTDAETVPATWANPGYDDSAWPSGTAPLGFGSTVVATPTWGTDPATRPITGQYRTTFEVEDPSEWDVVTLDVWADDGAQILLNGVEVGRRNLPSGAVTQTTYATAAPRSSLSPGTVTRLEVPASALRQGTNVLAVQAHLNYRRTPDSVVEATVTLLHEAN